MGLTSSRPISDGLQPAESAPDSTGRSEQRPASLRESTLRVAIGSADGKFVHEHFGRATHFQIFDLTGDTLRFVETRITTPACQHDSHDDRQLERTVDLVSDVDVVLVAAIGPAAEAALATRGVRAFAIQDFIPDALQALQKAVSRAQLTGKSTILQQVWRADHEQEA